MGVKSFDNTGEKINRSKRKRPVCPYCGKQIAFSDLFDNRKYANARCKNCNRNYRIWYPRKAYLYGICIVVFSIALYLLLFPSGERDVPVYLIPIFVLFYTLFACLTPFLIRTKKMPEKTSTDTVVIRKQSRSSPNVGKKRNF